MKRKYLVNNTKYYKVDNISEFISLLGKYDKANEVVKALHCVATTINNEKNFKIVKEAIFKVSSMLSYKNVNVNANNQSLLSSFEK